MVEIKEAQSEIQTLIGSLNQLTSTLNNSINTTKTNKLKTGIQSISNDINKANEKANLFKKALNFGAIAIGLSKAYGITKNVAQEYIDMIETNNLFEVVMGKVVDEYGNLDTVSSKYYIRAMEFQDKMNEKLATNKAEMQEYQAMYYAMLTSQGIDRDSSYLMSESLTKAGYDIASLYNLDVDKAMGKLQSGLAGQVKSLRDIGIDVSESSLQRILNNVGIERSVEQLSYAEKEVARYIAIMQQAGKAQGDFANTFEQPANQIKVFKNQLAELRQVAGSFITNAFGSILVYANAVIMAIKEILKFFATLFGYDLSSGGSTNLNESVGADELASNLNTATGSAKKLKNILMGFDEINNITLPESGGSGSAGANANGIDDKLLKALKEWDNQMDSISGKAQQIRDKLLEWLGFTKDVHGNLQWSWKDMNGIAKAIAIIAGIIAGISLIGKIVKLVTWLNTLFKILKTGEGAVTTFGLGVQTIGKYFKSGISNISDFITYFKVLKLEGNTTSSALVGSFKEVWHSIGNGTKLLIGAGGLIGSCSLASQTMKDLSNNTIGTGEAFLKMAGSIAGATASGAAIGSIFGPAGTVIGALAGATLDVVVAYTSYETEADKSISKAKEVNKAAHEEADAWRELKQEIQYTMDTQLAEQDYNLMLVNELETLVDANGRVKKGYEDRVTFILNELNSAFGTEYQLINGQIAQNGKLIGSIDDITSAIKKQIQAKKAQIVLDANEKLYSEEIQSKAEKYLKLADATQKQTAAQKEYNDAYKALNDYVSNTNPLLQNSTIITDLTNKLETAENKLNICNDTLRTTKETYQECSSTIMQYEELQTAVLTGSLEEQTMAIEKYTNTVQTESGKRNLTLKEEMGMAKADLEAMKEFYSNNGKEITAEVEESLNNRIRIVGNKLVEETQTVENLTNDNVEAWRTMGEESYTVYAEELNKMTPELKNEIQKMTGVYIEKTPELEKVVEEMSTKMIEQLDNNEEMRETAVDNIREYLNGLSDAKQRELLQQAGIENADEVMKGLKEGNLAEDVGINIVKGLHRGLKNDYWQGQTLSTASSFSTRILNKFKTAFGIQSPSKKTKRFGMYLLEGLGIGIEKEEGNVLKTVTEFSEELLNKMDNSLNNFSGIQVSAKDASIDATSYVNYGAISGNILAQSNVSVNENIIQGIAEAVSNAMKTTEVNVNIEAKTEEGVIVKKASQGFKEYVRQTGELPFPVPV